MAVNAVYLVLAPTEMYVFLKRTVLYEAHLTISNPILKLHWPKPTKSSTLRCLKCLKHPGVQVSEYYGCPSALNTQVPRALNAMVPFKLASVSSG